MTFGTTLQICVIFCYPLLLLVYLSLGLDIMNDTLEPIFGADYLSVTIHSDIYVTTIWIITISSAVLYHFLNDNSTIIVATLCMLFVLSLLAKSGYNEFIDLQAHIMQRQYVEVLLNSTFCSICVYKQFSLFAQLKKQYLQFDGNHKNAKTENNYFTMYLKWFMYLLTNIFLYLYCVVYLNKCNAVNILNVTHKFWLLIGPIPCYMLPFNIKYDLYYDRTQMLSMLICLWIGDMWCALWSGFFKNYLHPFIHIFIVYLFFLSSFVSFMALPKIFEKYKQVKFEKLVHNNNNNIQLSFWQYILTNNFDQFSTYLSNTMCIENLLFTIELIQYKNAVFTKLNQANINVNNGYLLPFNYNINNLYSVLDLSPIVTNILNEEIIQQITIKKIKIDLQCLYFKYMSQNAILYATFASYTNRKQILDLLTTMNSFQVLNVFDDAIKETDSILQLLYREHVLSL